MFSNKDMFIAFIEDIKDLISNEEGESIKKACKILINVLKEYKKANDFLVKENQSLSKKLLEPFSKN